MKITTDTLDTDVLSYSLDTSVLIIDSDTLKIDSSIIEVTKDTNTSLKMDNSGILINSKNGSIAINTKSVMPCSDSTTSLGADNNRYSAVYANTIYAKGFNSTGGIDVSCVNVTPNGINAATFLHVCTPNISAVPYCIVSDKSLSDYIPINEINTTDSSGTTKTDALNFASVSGGTILTYRFNMDDSEFENSEYTEEKGLYTTTTKTYTQLVGGVDDMILSNVIFSISGDNSGYKKTLSISLYAGNKSISTEYKKELDYGSTGQNGIIYTIGDVRLKGRYVFESDDIILSNSDDIYIRITLSNAFDYSCNFKCSSIDSINVPYKKYIKESRKYKKYTATTPNGFISVLDEKNYFLVDNSGTETEIKLCKNGSVKDIG